MALIQDEIEQRGFARTEISWHNLSYMLWTMSIVDSKE